MDISKKRGDKSLILRKSNKQFPTICQHISGKASLEFMLLNKDEHSPQCPVSTAQGKIPAQSPFQNAGCLLATLCIHLSFLSIQAFKLGRDNHSLTKMSESLFEMHLMAYVLFRFSKSNLSYNQVCIKQDSIELTFNRKESKQVDTWSRVYRNLFWEAIV